jgi:hypothetical protein
VKLTTHIHLVPRLENEWSYTSTPQYEFMAWCSVKEAQGQLYFYLYLREIGIDGSYWIRLAQDRDQWRAVVNTILNLRVP